MNYHQDSVSGVNIAYIGGGSRLWAWRLMADLALEEQLSGTIKLYDIDFESALENEQMGNLFSAHTAAKGKWRYQAVRSLKEALEGADFVVLSILPGTMEEMASDVHLPEKYGIYQPVGDTAGPGGIMRTLRTIPIYAGFAAAIKEFAPEAWIINYTNPMALCVRTLYEVFPQVKVFGCCHEVFSTQELLAAVVEDQLGVKGVTRAAIRTNVVGINHFTWIDQASYRGTDLFPVYRRFVDKHFEAGFATPGKGPWTKNVFNCGNRVKFDLFRRYGLIAAAGDRHLVEFLPPWYLKDLETVKSWQFHLTGIDFRRARLAEANQERREIITGKKEPKLEASGEEGVKLIKALLGLGDYVANVNLPNQGQMPDLPQGAVVETNALFRLNSVQPVVCRRMPPAISALVSRQVCNQETVLQAALTKDRTLAFKAFVNDPLVTIGLQEAEELFDQMLKNTKKYLPGWEV
jgi:alpha-galactosidase/6-phospho-beta-glucosidase family protein